MRTAGIVAEYNPFHLGHAYQIEQTRKNGAKHIVAVMSGNFVQRAEPAVAFKHARAEMALAGGADLVIELPLPWACAGARAFARAAVFLLGALGTVDVLSFGSESGDIAALQAAAMAVDSEEINNGLLRNCLADGSTFAQARQEAVRVAFGDAAATVLGSPNDTLAVEYLRAAARIQAPRDVMVITRKGAGHDADRQEDGFASASMIRSLIKDGKEYARFVPSSTAELLRREISCGKAPALYERLNTAVLCSLRGMTAQQIATAPDVSEGIENRLYEAVRSAVTLDEVFSFAKTKRYSHARIRRLVLHAFLGIREQDTNADPPYIRVLACNDAGQAVLRAARKKATLPIVMKTADIRQLDERAQRVFALECAATDIFAFAVPNPLPCGTEQTANVIIKKQSSIFRG